MSLLQNLNKPENIFFINAIIVSEVTYILKRKLNLDIIKISEYLKDFNILTIDSTVVSIAYNYMHKYNMKNDAIIAASCKYHKINNLITLDKDFKKVCTKENIKLIL